MLSSNLQGRRNDLFWGSSVPIQRLERDALKSTHVELALVGASEELLQRLALPNFYRKGPSLARHEYDQA